MLKELTSYTTVLTKASKLTGVSKAKVLHESYKLDDKNNCWMLYEFVKDLMIGVSIKEFLQCYPLRKSYDGERYGIKDYFYSNTYVKTLMSISDVFTEENIAEFLMEVELEDALFRRLPIYMMLGVSHKWKQTKGTDMLDSLFYGLQNKPTKALETNYLKLVR